MPEKTEDILMDFEAAYMSAIENRPKDMYISELTIKVRGLSHPLIEKSDEDKTAKYWTVTYVSCLTCDKPKGVYDLHLGWVTKEDAEIGGEL